MGIGIVSRGADGTLCHRDRKATDQFPSPLHTPKSSSHGRVVYQTPVHEATSKQISSGELSWMQNTPATLSSAEAREKSDGTLQSPGGANQVLINAELARHTHHLSSNPLQTLLPVEPSRQLGSSPVLSSNSKFSATNTENNSQIQHKNNFALRTPPPSASWNRQSATMPDPQKPLSNTRALMPPPETPGRHVQPSPQFLSNLQFSPDLYQFPMSGPATAPVLPQQKLFWDPSNGNDTVANIMQYSDSFTHDHASYINSMFPSPGLESNLPGSVEQQPYDLPGSSTSRTETAPVDAFIDGTTFPAPFTTSPRKPPPRTEDPTLFLSSPARRFGGESSSNSRINRSNWDKPAYHHQIEESKREREFERARKAKAKRLSGIFPPVELSRRPASPARDNRPVLKRSLTHTGVGKPHLRNQSHVSFADSVSNMSITSHRGPAGGRSSPLKTSRNSLHPASSLHRQRTSLSLSIDKDGRAKTVITKTDGPDLSFLDLDEDSCSSSSGTESLDESDSRFLSKNHRSFVFSDMEDSTSRSSQAMHRPRPYSHISQNSNFGLSTSMSQPSWAASRTAGGRLAGARGESFSIDPDAMDEDTDNISGPSESGDAQKALRAIMKDRPRSRSTHDGSISGQGSTSHSQYNSSPPVPQTSFGAFNVSPTTITDPDAITPSTDRESPGSISSTRCVCNSTSTDGVFMIKW